MIDDAAKFSRSRAFHERAIQHLACGASSTPRSSQLPVPICAAKADGVYLTDIDGNTYIDYALGYGPLFLGHTPAMVISAITQELANGLRTASIHAGEAQLAELIAQCVPSAAVSTFVSTGSEAIALAIRLARALTGNLKIVKFRGHYHGWLDNIHLATLPGNDGAGTIGQDPNAGLAVVVLDWGDADALEDVLTSDFAAVLLEPAAINSGCFEPPDGFLQSVRALTSRLGVVLIFDEIITGFRMALGGAQERYGVLPDLTVLGKTLAAGLPVGAVCGNRAFMQPIISRRMMHRGTFNGNPLSMAAGVACLTYLQSCGPEVYARTESLAIDLRQHVESEADRLGALVCAKQAGPVVQIFAGAREFPNLADAAFVNKPGVLALSADLLRCGVHIIPRGCMYISTMHTQADISQTKSALTQALECSVVRRGHNQGVM